MKSFAAIVICLCLTSLSYATCPSQKLHPAIVPADRTHAEFGDGREKGLGEAWNPAHQAVSSSRADRKRRTNQASRRAGSRGTRVSVMQSADLLSGDHLAP